jgi:hypothetical protein
VFDLDCREGPAEDDPSNEELNKDMLVCYAFDYDVALGVAGFQKY